MIYCNEVTAKPIKQVIHIKRVEVLSNQPRIVLLKQSNGKLITVSVPTQNTKFRSVAASTNVAFGSVNMINQHAINHNLNKEVAIKKKPGRRLTRVPTLVSHEKDKPTLVQSMPCIVALPDTLKDISAVGSNSLFMSRNWGNQ